MVAAARAAVTVVCSVWHRWRSWRREGPWMREERMCVLRREREREREREVVGISGEGTVGRLSSLCMCKRRRRIIRWFRSEVKTIAFGVCG